MFAFGKISPIEVQFTSKILVSSTEQITSIKTFEVNGHLYTFIGTANGVAHKVNL